VNTSNALKRRQAVHKVEKNLHGRSRSAAGSGFFSILILGRHLTLASLKENRLALVSFYERHQFAMVAVFIAVYILQTALSLPGAAILSLAAGAVFGVLMGTLYVNIVRQSGRPSAFSGTLPFPMTLSRTNSDPVSREDEPGAGVPGAQLPSLPEAGSAFPVLSH